MKNKKEKDTKHAENNQYKEKEQAQTENHTKNEVLENNNQQIRQTENENTDNTKNCDDNETIINELKKNNEELNDKYLRLYSEFDNYRKRTTKEKLDLRKTAAEDLILSILPVVDDFERAFQSIKEAKDIDSLKEGIQLVFNKFKNILNQHGVEEINAIGEKFDAEVHEAITNVPSESEDKKGTIVDQTQKGYMMNGKVIRFPKVVVAN